MDKSKKALRLGLFITIALILFVVAVYVIGSQGNLFSSTTDLRSSFQDIRGLQVGNNVRYAGINIGTVKGIQIENDSSVVVTFSVRSQYTDYIYKNSTVQIGQEGLMGGKIMMISSGDASSGKVEEGDFLAVGKGLDIQEVVTEAQLMLTEAKNTVANLRMVTDKINQGQGDIGKLVNDDQISRQLTEASTKINASLGDINKMTKQVSSGQGDLGKLIYDDNLTTEIGAIMANLNTVSNSADSAITGINQAVNAINHGDGTIARLINDPQMGLNIDTAVSKVDQGVVEITRAANTIADSWIFRLFSGRKKKKQDAPKQEFSVSKGDTVVIKDDGTAKKIEE